MFREAAMPVFVRGDVKADVIAAGQIPPLERRGHPQKLIGDCHNVGCEMHLTGPFG